MTETDKRQAILQATLALIAEYGFHGTSVAMIVKASRVSTGIVYHYFQSKDEIIAALYREIKRDFGLALLVELLPSDGWQVRLQQVWRNAFHYFAAHPKEMRFLEQYENSPYVQKVHTYAPDEPFAQLEGMIVADIANGDIKALPYPALYALTFGVALAVAKAYSNGQIAADSATLDLIALACCQAIAA